MNLFKVMQDNSKINKNILSSENLLRTLRYVLCVIQNEFEITINYL